MESDMQLNNNLAKGDSRKKMKIKTIVKQRIRRQEAIWTTKKAEKALLQIAGALTFIVIVNSLINIAQAEPTVHYLENKPIDYGTSIDPESEHLSDAHADEGKDGTAVDIVSTETIEEKIAKAFPEAPEIMIAVAKAESGMNPKAMHTNNNGSIDIGLFQVNSIHGYDQLELTKVEKNIEVARKVYDKQGLSAWSVINNGAYKKFL